MHSHTSAAFSTRGMRGGLGMRRRMRRRVRGACTSGGVEEGGRVVVHQHIHIYLVLAHKGQGGEVVARREKGAGATDDEELRVQHL
jgi:hypothetical protein